MLMISALCLVVDEVDIPEMNIELSMLDKLKYRVQLARKIETAQHRVKKSKHDRNWMKETAEVLGVELDSDYVRFVDFLLSSPPSTVGAEWTPSFT